jgi:hypothetical protein
MSPTPAVFDRGRPSASVPSTSHCPSDPFNPSISNRHHDNHAASAFSSCLPLVHFPNWLCFLQYSPYAPCPSVSSHRRPLQQQTRNTSGHTLPFCTNGFHLPVKPPASSLLGPSSSSQAIPLFCQHPFWKSNCPTSTCALVTPTSRIYPSLPALSPSIMPCLPGSMEQCSVWFFPHQLPTV